MDVLADAAEYISDEDDMVRLEQNERRKRFRAGKAFIVLANKEAYEAERRERDPNYKDQMKANWHAKKDIYNENRRKRREEAHEELRKAGYYVKSGRPSLPPGATLIPKAAIEPVSLDELVLLGDPKSFDKVDYQIKVPDDYARVAAYLGVSVINADVSPLKWGVWRFAAWDELQKVTRSGYIGNARNSLGGDVGYLQDPKNKNAYDQYLLYDSVKDRYYTNLEKDLVEEANPETVEILDEAPKKGRAPFSRNPIRVVDFMLAIENFDPWFVVQQTCDQAYTVANARASALASVCYAYCRKLFKDGNFKGELFAKVLRWSFIFERYTRVAKRITGDKHASQQTTKEKAENTVEWGQWRQAAKKFLERYFVFGANNTVKIRTRATGWVPWWKGHPTTMRGRIIVLDNEDTEKQIVPKTLLPWWKEDYLETQKDRDAPNLRELRDCAMLACYSLLAPIRLDWSTVEIKTETEFAAFKVEKDKADQAKVQDDNIANPLIEPSDEVKKKRKASQKAFNINILVVDNKDAPTRASMAYFGKMKNIKAFRQTPVPKYIRKESPLCENILLAFLNERRRLGFKSDCLFPYSTYMDIDLKPKPADVKQMYCFNNSAFGERLADLSYDLTRKNFTETLMRRSYITWYWKQPGNSPLSEAKWAELLPSVHQNSKSANLGYLKGFNEEYDAWIKAAKRTNDEINQFRNDLERRALQQEGQDLDAGQNPENDAFDEQEIKQTKELIATNRKEEKYKVAELRRSKRLDKGPDAAPFVPKENPIVEAGELALDAAAAAQDALQAIEVLQAPKPKRKPKAKDEPNPKPITMRVAPQPAPPEGEQVEGLRRGARRQGERRRYFA